MNELSRKIVHGKNADGQPVEILLVDRGVGTAFDSRGIRYSALITEILFGNFHDLIAFDEKFARDWGSVEEFRNSEIQNYIAGLGIQLTESLQ